MTVKELCEKLGGKLLTQAGGDNDITCGCSCDLLSWVMAKGAPGCAWVTVQTHMNVIAVASLHDMACVICPEGLMPDENVLKKAEEEEIAVISSGDTGYAICCKMHEAGIMPER
ncbi:MAG: AraC family transcriptional regulator [Clostridia bacterium]|nr:AraC family transcriptional regulator [Clostridia bacterium]